MPVLRKSYRQRTFVLHPPLKLDNHRLPRQVVQERLRVDRHGLRSQAHAVKPTRRRASPPQPTLRHSRTAAMAPTPRPQRPSLRCGAHASAPLPSILLLAAQWGHAGPGPPGGRGVAPPSSPAGRPTDRGPARACMCITCIHVHHAPPPPGDATCPHVLSLAGTVRMHLRARDVGGASTRQHAGPLRASPGTWRGWVCGWRCVHSQGAAPPSPAPGRTGSVTVFSFSSSLSFSPSGCRRGCRREAALVTPRGPAARRGAASVPAAALRERADGEGLVAQASGLGGGRGSAQKSVVSRVENSPPPCKPRRPCSWPAAKATASSL